MGTAKGLRVLVVDDEELARLRLRGLVNECPAPRASVVGEAANVAQALVWLATQQCDVLLLDIQMPGIDGMAVARTLAAKGARPAIIFVTAFDAFAIAAFDVAAVDYLLKPVAPERLERAIARVRTQLETAPAAGDPSPWTQEFWVPHRAEIIRIAARDIDLIEAERDYMRLHVGVLSFLLHQTITELEQKLDPAEFVRLHRSTIVQRDRITGFKRDSAGVWQAQMRDGRLLRVGRTYLANARAMAGR